MSRMRLMHLNKWSLNRNACTVKALSPICSFSMSNAIDNTSSLNESYKYSKLMYTSLKYAFDELGMGEDDVDGANNVHLSFPTICKQGIHDVYYMHMYGLEVWDRDLQDLTLTFILRNI